MTDIRPNDIIVGEDDVQKAQGVLSSQGYNVSSRVYFKGTRTGNGGYTPGKSLLSISGGNVEEARNILKQNNIVAHTGSTTRLNGSGNQAAANNAQYTQSSGRAANNERYGDAAMPTEQGANLPVPQKAASNSTTQESRTYGAAKVEGMRAMEGSITTQDGPSLSAGKPIGADDSKKNEQGAKATGNDYAARRQETRDLASRGLNMHGQPIKQAPSISESGTGWSSSRNGVPSVGGRPAMKGVITSQGGPTLGGRGGRVGVVAAGASSKISSSTGTGLRTNSKDKKNGKKKLTRAQRREEARIKHSDPSGVMAGSKEAAGEITSMIGWLLFGLSVVKDGLDILFNFLDAIGLAADVTFIGLIVGVPLMALSFILDIILSLALFATNMIYFFLTFSITAQQQTMQAQNEASARERTTGPQEPGAAQRAAAQAKKVLSDSMQNLINRAKGVFLKRLMILSITTFLGMIPVIDILPESIIGFILAMAVGRNMNKKGKK